MTAVRRNRWRELDGARRRLLCRAAWWLSLASGAVALFQFNRAIRLGCVNGSESDDCSIADIVWAVEAAARRLPWRTMCIEKGIAVQRVLRASGFDAILHYGARQHAVHGQLEAHVWVSVGEVVVMGGDEMVGFAEVATYK